jgi:hypothetical protein
MLIPVRGEGSQIVEWALIELQGKIEDVGGEDQQVISRELGRLQAVQVCACMCTKETHRFLKCEKKQIRPAAGDSWAIAQHTMWQWQ